MFYAGNQSFVNRQFNFSSSSQFQSYYFNLVQQPVNMVTGYQRQHRKSINYIPTEGADPNTTDQYTRLMTNVINRGGIHEIFSKSCEYAAVSGLNLMQPYLDYTGDDPAQGELKVKIWEYNSFMCDVYFRSYADMADANIVWCQEYIDPIEAELRFPDKVSTIRPMAASPHRYGDFYFLPENYNLQTNQMLVVSYVWYKGKTQKKRLYSKKRNQFFDFAGGDGNLEQILYHIEDMEPVTVTVPCWKLAVILNDQLMYNGKNPLGVDTDCPFIPNYWNLDNHINDMNLRDRSLVFPMRSPQFLFNYKVINNNDIAAATLNNGWKRKSGAVANEDNLKRSGQGYDIIINEGYELVDCEKIIPSAVPESDLALAQQMSDLIFQTSGIQLENWSGQDDKQISTLTALIKQAANLMVFQKYFDQWDSALKVLGTRMLQIVLQNWNASKVGMLIGEEPSPHFYSKIFAKYQVVVEEGLLTPTQKNFQAQQLLEINERFGREVFPPSFIIKDMNLQGKTQAIEFLQQQEQAMQAAQAEQQNIAHAFEDAKLKEMISKATLNLASARERQGRSEADIGLFEERLSMITKNRAMATKEKMEALEKLIDVIAKYGEIETALKMNELDSIGMEQQVDEDIEKVDAKRTSLSNDFVSSMMTNNMGQQPQQQPQDMAGV